MSRIPASVIILGLIAVSMMIIPEEKVIAEPSRDGSVDLTADVNLPVDGGSYQTEHGLIVNITIRNIGNITANGTGRASLVIRDNSTGSIAHSATSSTFTDLAPGSEINITFQNWTSAYAGQFKLNVSVLYMGDSNLTNNYIEGKFSMWTENWPFPPKLDYFKVEPTKGEVDTDFTYTAEYNFNEPPQEVRVEIDGVNHTMTETDPEDQIYQDGKFYEFTTKLPVGNHRYRIFVKVQGWKDLSVDNSSLPWVNISLKDPQVVPVKAYVTTPFRFSILYGSFSSLAPDEIYVLANGRKFNMTLTSPTPIYLTANVKFEASVRGIDLLPSPLEYTINARTGPDIYSIGPFSMEGPSLETVNVTGTVTDFDMTPIEGVRIELDTGEFAYTDQAGVYGFLAYKGSSYTIIYSRDGYRQRQYTIDLMEDRLLNIQLETLPVGASLSGFVLTTVEGETYPVSGASINLSNPAYTNETITDTHGYYTFTDVPAGTGYVLRAEEERFDTYAYSLDVENGAEIERNITLMERDMNITVVPEPGMERIDISETFTVILPIQPDPDSINISLMNMTSSIPILIEKDTNSTILEIVPSSPLNYNDEIYLVIRNGMGSVSGKPIVWRDLRFKFITRFQDRLANPMTDPVHDSVFIPLDQNITISWGIGLNMSTFAFELIELKGLTSIEGTLSYVNTLNWSNSGRTDTMIKIIPSNLTYDTRYSLEIAGGLTDIYGNILFTTTYIMEFTTVGEPDRDNDGVVDSEDAFPDDPYEWSDLDKDGRGDQRSDDFPEDPDEWSDTDGDGTGDNADKDDDNDGMPDDWENKYDLDPLDPDDAFLDADGDGTNNLKEYLEGTDPTDKNSKPDPDDSEIPIWVLIGGLLVLLLVAIAAVMLVVRSRDSGKGTGFEE